MSVTLLRLGVKNHNYAEPIMIVDREIDVTREKDIGYVLPTLIPIPDLRG